jgi:hypothetical protein
MLTKATDDAAYFCVGGDRSALLHKCDRFPEIGDCNLEREVIMFSSHSAIGLRSIVAIAPQGLRIWD